ncbi:MAG TPA: glucan biosynthesis protein, partial [Verrucomicrobiae bacterium]|nr:glucan biosynthesis protein [Verrucomicrobiae bacterium]
YTMYWQGGDADLRLSPDRVVGTRVGLDYHFPNTRQFVIDFAGPDLEKLPADTQLQAISNCSTNAVIDDCQVLRPCDLPSLKHKRWRVILKMQPKSGNSGPVDLRCTLQRGTNVVTETWVYQWSPP